MEKRGFGWRLWLSSSVPDLLALAGDPLAFKAKAEETFVEIMSTVFLKAREAKIAVPEWAWKQRFEKSFEQISRPMRELATSQKMGSGLAYERSGRSRTAKTLLADRSREKGRAMIQSTLNEHFPNRSS